MSRRRQALAVRHRPVEAAAVAGRCPSTCGCAGDAAGAFAAAVSAAGARLRTRKFLGILSFCGRSVSMASSPIWKTEPSRISSYDRRAKTFLCRACTNDICCTCGAVRDGNTPVPACVSPGPSNIVTPCIRHAAHRSPEHRLTTPLVSGHLQLRHSMEHAPPCSQTRSACSLTTGNRR